MTSRPSGTIVDGEITPERFARLTGHLRVNGKPFESLLLRLQQEKLAEKRDEPKPEEL